jgi:hypothetical protein
MRSKLVMCTAVLTVSLGLSASALSAECKGQLQSQCEGSQSCSWVDGYERKDGRSVKGFCRTKSKGGKLNTKTKPKKALKPKSI